MSGGSWNYLCFKELGDLASNLELLNDMADRLASLGYAKKAAENTVIFITKLNDINDFLENSGIRGVWQAVEWKDSMDYGEDDLRSVCEDYEKIDIGS